MSETITAVEIQETDFGEKVVLDSPYDAREYIAYMPWENGDGTNPDELDEDTDEPDFEFSDGFEAHHTWDGEAYNWLVDVDAFSEIREYFESVGFEVTVDGDVNEDVF